MIKSHVITEDVLSSTAQKPPTDVLSALQRIVTVLDSISAKLTVQNQSKAFQPHAISYKTSNVATAPKQLVPNSIKTSHFVIQNNGSSVINIGTETDQPVWIAAGSAPPAGSMFFYSLSLDNYEIDLSTLYISSPGISVPYSVMWFV